MRHRKISFLALTLALALASGVALFAQETSSSTGKVTNVDTTAGTITMTTASGSTETFSTDSQSMYMSNGRTIDLRTVRVGDQVTITYRDSNGAKTVTHVDVVSSPTGTAPSPTDGTDMNGRANDYRTGTDTTGRTPRSTTTSPTDGTNMPYHTDEPLPRTASPLPLIGLTAGLFGVAALTLAAFRRFVV